MSNNSDFCETPDCSSDETLEDPPESTLDVHMGDDLHKTMLTLKSFIENSFQDDSSRPRSGAPVHELFKSIEAKYEKIDTNDKSPAPILNSINRLLCSVEQCQSQAHEIERILDLWSDCLMCFRDFIELVYPKNKSYNGASLSKIRLAVLKAKIEQTMGNSKFNHFDLKTLCEELDNVGAPEVDTAFFVQRIAKIQMWVTTHWPESRFSDEMAFFNGFEHIEFEQQGRSRQQNQVLLSWTTMVVALITKQLSREWSFPCDLIFNKIGLKLPVEEDMNVLECQFSMLKALVALLHDSTKSEAQCAMILQRCYKLADALQFKDQRQDRFPLIHFYMKLHEVISAIDAGLQSSNSVSRTIGLEFNGENYGSQIGFNWGNFNP